MSLKSSVRNLIPEWLLNWYHWLWTFFGALAYGFPGLLRQGFGGQGRNKTMKIIGVTGTSGKSTTVNFISAILEEAGYNVASVSSIRFKIGKKEWTNPYKMTMPGRFTIQKFLRQAVNAKCDFAVLEVTSEGIRQNRHKFIRFDTAVFNNLSMEHIESHGSFENYRNEKLKLFRVTKNRHVINGDDENAKYFLDVPAKEKISFSPKDAHVELSLQGDFNKANAAAAIAVVKSYGVGMKHYQSALEKIKSIPGRMEIVSEHPKVVVDYAHTPEQLEQVYKSFKNQKLIAVLGSCGGGRDKWKRPELGKIAKQYASKIYITNEDPYDEDPMEIINAVAATAGSKAEIVPDRKEAIQKAIASAGENDAVIITGKGSEVWMVVAGGKKIPWSDKDIALAALSKRP
jgi:UDP-N-acetylmuramoyl-L-alanyl-D-glutamate--2,6-diaminopimelate ligase